MILIEIKSQDFNSEFAKRIEATRNPVGMLDVVGRELGNQLKAHFRQRDEDNVNKLNPGRREHFWLQIGRSVQPAVVSGSPGSRTVSVTIMDDRLAQKVFGGPIVAKNADELTIPESPEAYGRTARTFTAETGLKLFIVIIGGTKGPGYAKNDFETAVLAAQIGGKFEVEYILTKSVNQKADPNALPDRTKLESALISRADKYMGRQSAETGGKS